MQSDFQYTGMMNTALQFINSTGRHVFLTGKAGTGKTTFLKNLLLSTHKQAVVVAPTGIAALNAGGTTIHSQFLLPFGMFVPDRNYAEPPVNGANWYTETVLAKRHPLNSIRRQVLRSIDLLVIDEVSMLRADLLDAIDYRLRSVRGNFRQSFGGVQLLLIGDLYQLPPVIKREEESRMRQFYNSAWFFESKGLQRDGFAYIELDKIFRQSDNTFIRILNNLRVNRLTREDIEALNEHYYTAEKIAELTDVITLTTHNYKADEMNTKALAELETKSHFFEAIIKDDFPDNMVPVLQRLELKVGAQIMFTRNDSEEGVYYNGKLATVTSISGTEVTVALAGSTKPYTLRRVVWENKKYSINAETKDLEEEIIGSFEQFPVRLAWAITVHKSQGLTFDKAIIDVAQAFADGQVYVALSRLRSIDGLILRTKVSFDVISTDKQIVSFDQQNNKPASLESDMKLQQKEYLRQQINRSFDFDSLSREINYIGKDNDTAARLDSSMKPILQQIKDALYAESGNTVRFREQLRMLLDQEKHDEFLVRVTKGSDYYKKLLWDQLKVLAQHIADMRNEKRVKGYVTDLGDLDQLFFKKLEEVDTLFHLAEGVLTGKTQFSFETLRRERASLREKMLSEITKPASKPKKARKKKAPSAVSTHETSILMAESGLSIDDIAKERGLVRSTIEGHLTKGIESGRIQIFQFMSEADVEKITEALKQMNEGFTSNDLYSKLNGAFTYGQLRAVMTHTGIRSTPKKDLSDN